MVFCWAYIYKGGNHLKVKDIYENALALNISYMDEEDNLEFFAIKLFNIILAEVFVYNNQLREKKGLSKMSEAPIVESVDDEIPYERELYAPLSYGLASKLLAAQEEMSLASLYNNQYAVLLEMTSPAVPVEVI